MQALQELRERATELEGNGYHAWPKQGWGVELEVGDLLWGIVRTLRPLLILESGTGVAISTRFLASACIENAYGRVVTFEPDEGLQKRAIRRVRGMPVEVRGGDTLSYKGPDPQLVFIDSYPHDRRMSELQYWLTRPVLVVVHDAFRYAATLQGGVLLSSARGVWIGRGNAV